MTASEWQEEVLERLRVAVARRMVADVPVGVLLSGGIDSSLVVALLAGEGQTDLTTFSIGFEAAGGESGDEFFYSDLIADHFGTRHHQIRIPTSDVLPAVEQAIARHERADGQPRLRGVLPAVAGGFEDRPRRAVGPGGRRDLRRIRLVPAAGRGRPGRGADGVRAKSSSTAPTRRCGRCCKPQWHLDGDPSRAFVAEPLRRSRRRDGAGCGAADRQPDHAGRRPGQARRQHDDGLGTGSPGALPRPRGRRAGRAVPARAEARRRRQGRAEGGQPQGASGRGDRPPEGLLPGAGDPPPVRARCSIA